jgi:DNA-binding SARP family transcriptional activator
VAPADHFVITEHETIAVNLSHLAIDVEEFLGEVRHGLGLLRQHRASQAYSVLAAALPRYAGDFLVDEPYADWAAATRHEAQSAYLHALRALAELARQAGDVNDAVGYLHRLLEHDPYDEPAHHGLINTLAAAGRHGQSRQARTRYLNAMTDLGPPPPLVGLTF